MVAKHAPLHSGLDSRKNLRGICKVLRRVRAGFLRHSHYDHEDRGARSYGVAVDSFFIGEFMFCLVICTS